MSWRDRLIDASFKNIPFKVLSHEYTAGRRTQLHQFANREEPFLQDLGGEADLHSIDAYIVQSITNEYDYFSERDDLINGLKQKGAGVLIHPFLGLKKVGCTTFTLSETFEEGGIAKFTINFTEKGERALPEVLTDFFTNVDNAVNQSMDMVGDAFYKAYSTTDLFQDTVLNALGRTIGTVQAATSLTSGIATKIISESVANVTVIRNAINDIIDSPNDIFNALKNTSYSMASVCGMSSVLLLEQSIKGYATDNGVAINDRSEDIFADKITLSTDITGGESGQYSGISRGNVVILDPNNIDETLGKSVVNNMLNLITDFDMSGYSATPPEQQNNIVLILDTFNFQIIATICRIAIRINFFGEEEIIEYMKKINVIIDNVLVIMANEAAEGSLSAGIGNGTTQINNKDTFLAIQDIRKVFTDNMILKASYAKKVLDYRIPVNVETTLELAYEKYLDLDRSSEIYKRNKTIIQHPGFMPNNEIIRILDE